MLDYLVLNIEIFLKKSWKSSNTAVYPTRISDKPVAKVTGLDDPPQLLILIIDHFIT